MNIIKIILAILAVLFGVMAVFWLLGIVWSLLGYVFWIGLLTAVGYGGYRLFKGAERKFVGPGAAHDEIEERDFNMSWDEYEKKYLHK